MIKPVTYRDLRHVFGKIIIPKLRKSVADSLLYADENTFAVLRELHGKKLYTTDVVTEEDILDAALEQESPSRRTCSFSGLMGKSAKIERKLRDNEIFPLLFYHIHPPGRSSTPSEMDLDNLADMREWNYIHFGLDNRPLAAIASVYQDYMNLLVMQEKKDAPMEEGAPPYFFVHGQREYDRDDNETIARLYDSSPWLNAALLRYRKVDGKGNFAISEEELEKLRRFAYTPTLLPDPKED